MTWRQDKDAAKAQYYEDKPLRWRIYPAYLVVFFLCLVLSLPAAAQRLLAPQPRLAPDRSLEIFEQKLDRAAQGDDFVGLAVAVVKDGETVLLRTYGTRAVGTAAPVNAATRFRIASLSKGFASALAVKLATENELDLMAPVTRFVPQFTLADQNYKRLTLEHVLSHRLGLPPYAYDNLLEAQVPLPTIFDRLSKLKPICPAGSCYGYQNIAYSLIEPAISRATGLPFHIAVENYLFQPLAMASASYGMAALTADDNWARPHARKRTGWYQVDMDDAYYRVPSAGGVNASIEDMTKWLKAQMGYAPDVLSPDALRIEQTPRVQTRAELRRLRWLKDRVKDAHYALGWRIYDYAGRTIVMHNGGLEGYRAQIAFLPDANLGVVALWNSKSSRGWAIMPTLFDAYLRLEDTDWLKIDCIDAEEQATHTPCS